MSKLKELEKRLRNEPDNLGLRVLVAGALLDARRRADAVELYRSVAIAYRDQGRPQQAITVCRSILEVAPDDGACRALLAALTGGAAGPDDDAARYPPSEAADAGEPPRRSSLDVTPLPEPLPYHVADPTSISRLRLARGDLPPSLQQEHAMIPEIEGIANAARQISASLLAARQLDDFDDAGDDPDADDDVDVTSADDAFEAPRRARIDPHAALEHLGTLRPTVPLGRPAAVGGPDDERDEDELTFPPPLDAIPRARPVDEDKTKPRQASAGAQTLSGEVTEPRDLPRGIGTAATAVHDLPRSGPRSESTAPTPTRTRVEPRSESITPTPTPTRTRVEPRSESITPTPTRTRVEPRSESITPTRTRGKPPSIAPPTHATGPLASALFAPVPPRHRAAVLQRFRRRLAGVGTTVIRRGEAGHGLVLVVRGQLDVHAERSDGARISLDAIGPGDYVGEIGLVSRAPAAAYVVAATDSELLVLDAPAFYEVAGAFPTLWDAVRLVAERRARDHERLQA